MFLFFTPACKTESEPASTQEREFEQTNIIVPQHSILNEDLYDVPIKTQITLNILVSGEITEPGLRTLLGQLYSSIKNRKGFKYHDSPTNIYIYTYTSKEKYEAGWGEWVAMLEKGYDDTQSTIRINMQQK